MIGVQSGRQRAQHELELPAVGHVERDHLAGVQLTERVVGVVQRDRARHQPPTGVVSKQPLAETRAAGRVQEMAAVAGPPEQLVKLVAGRQPPDEPAIRQLRQRLIGVAGDRNGLRGRQPRRLE